MLLNEKIVLSMAVWAALCVALVGTGGLQLLGILFLIGILIARELSSVYIDGTTADRMDTMIYVGIIFFVGVVSHRILNILGFL